MLINFALPPCVSLFLSLLPGNLSDLVLRSYLNVFWIWSPSGKRKSVNKHLPKTHSVGAKLEANKGKNTGRALEELTLRFWYHHINTWLYACHFLIHLSSQPLIQHLSSTKNKGEKQYVIVITELALASEGSEFKSCFWIILAKWFWPNYLIFKCF